MEFIKSSKLNLLRNNEPWGVGGVAGAEESTAVAKGRSCRKIIRSAEMGGPLQYKV